MLEKKKSVNHRCITYISTHRANAKKDTQKNSSERKTENDGKKIAAVKRKKKESKHSQSLRNKAHVKHRSHAARSR